MKKFFAALLALGFLFIGCAERKVATKSEQPAATQETVQKTAAEKAKEEKIAELPVTKEGQSKGMGTVNAEEGSVMGKDISGSDNIYFDFDRYDIRDDAKPVLQSIASMLMNNRTSMMLIEGHCDERGTSEYNMALGEKRAKAARDYLVSLGVEKDRLKTISYGKEKPLCSEQTEECWQKNRRAHFITEGDKR